MSEKLASAEARQTAERIVSIVSTGTGLAVVLGNFQLRDFAYLHRTMAEQYKANVEQAIADSYAVITRGLRESSRKYMEITEELMSEEELSPFSFASTMHDYLTAKDELVKTLGMAEAAIKSATPQQGEVGNG